MENIDYLGESQGNWTSSSQPVRALFSTLQSVF